MIDSFYETFYEWVAYPIIVITDTSVLRAREIELH